MESALETAKQGWGLDTAQKGTSITGNVLLETHLYPSVWVLRAYPFPEVWLPGLGASLEIAQLREVPSCRPSWTEPSRQRCGEGGLRQGQLPFPTQTAVKLSHYRLSPTWAVDPTALQPSLRLPISPVDSHPGPAVQADLLAWPRPCLITTDLPGDGWAVPQPRRPDQTCPARRAWAPRPCALASEALPSAALVTVLGFWLTFHCRAAGPHRSPTLPLTETVGQTNRKVIEDANFIERPKSSYVAWVYSWVDDTENVQVALIQQNKLWNRMCGVLTEVKPNGQLFWDSNCK